MKCCCCHEDIDNKQNLKLKGKNYHYQCYIEKEKNKKKNRKSDLEIESDAKVLFAQTQEEYHKNKMKDDFYKYIQEIYDITLIPTYTFIKMNDIFKGNYKGLNKPIEVEDLLNMFKAKKETLDKMYSYNSAKGMKFDNLGRFNYDLAILLSKYDSYMKWKNKEEERKIEEISSKKSNDMLKIDKIIHQQNTTFLNKEKEDIDDLIDEI